MKTKNPDYLYEGQEVFVDARLVRPAIPNLKPGQGLRCKVLVAHGDGATVVNEAYRFRRLLGIWDLWVEITDGPER